MYVVATCNRSNPIAGTTSLDDQIRLSIFKEAADSFENTFDPLSRKAGILEERR